MCVVIYITSNDPRTSSLTNPLELKFTMPILKDALYHIGSVANSFKFTKSILPTLSRFWPILKAQQPHYSCCS